MESVAISLLFSFLNPEHEEKIVTALLDTDLFLSASYQLLPEFREYERTCTTVINSYVSPSAGQYIDKLERNLSPINIRIMQSNGGSISCEQAKMESVRTILSGPAGGVVGAYHIAKVAGYNRIITFDMGGTSTDVSLCDGALKVTKEGKIGSLPIRVPIIDIHTVGSGGGSIASIDAGGAMQVGPQSAGAVPGPVCYGKGGTLPTVTDANLILGRIQKDQATW